MISFPICKINLGLNIIAKREDGYHEIRSVLYPVEIKDILEVVTSDTFSFTSSGLKIPGSVSSNLCVKAYQLLEKDFNLPPVHIHLFKNIPMGGGLGGGSADGAFTLKLLNDFFELHLSSNQLQKYAASLGSDCPFFIEVKPQLATGRGEVLSPFQINLKGKVLVLINDGTHVSTEMAYKGIKPKLPMKNITEILKNPITTWRNDLTNDFEENVFERFPKLQKYKELLYESGAEYAAMTGSGSTLFGIFNDEPHLKNELRELKGFVKVVELQH